MSLREEEFLKRLLATFAIEADEHLTAMSTGLIELEKMPAADKQAAIIETVFREAHSLKGAARAVNLMDVEALCQPLENVFSVLKRQEIGLTPALFDILFDALDVIADVIHASEGVQPAQISQVIQQLNLAGNGRFESKVQPDIVDDTPQLEAKETRPPSKIQSPEVIAAKPGPDNGVEPEPKPVDTKIASESDDTEVEPEPADTEDEPAPVDTKAEELQSPKSPPKKSEPVGQKHVTEVEKPVAAETIRISTAKLDTLLLEVEEMLAAKLVTRQRAIDLREIMPLLDAWQKEWRKIHPTVRKVRQLIDENEAENGASRTITRLLDFLKWNQDQAEEIAAKLKKVTKSTEQDQRSVGGMVDNLLEDMKGALMMPFSSLLDIFPKMVRDLSRTQGKEVEFVCKGDETEIDRRILEEMKDPLIHLIRNCIDHGLEKPAEREKCGKPRRGKITVDIFQKVSGKVRVRVWDDGGGINIDKVKAAAIKHGIISKSEANTLDPLEATSLIFRSAVSTNPIVTDISGRGLGLAIVREKVEKLGGNVSVTSTPGTGTSFEIILPATLATFRGILIQVKDRMAVIRTLSVAQVLRVKPAEIKTVENKETILINNQVTPIVWLSDILELPRSTGNGGGKGLMPVVVLSLAGDQMAFIVDKILGEQEVLVKNLGKQLVRVRNVAGATILGSGKVVPILDVSDLLQSAVRTLPGQAALPVVDKKADTVPKSVLVVEDSITSRMLLKNVLEAAGYNVKTCVDGIDALTTLKTEPFDIVVSDIEMPRMNGFDLTAQIRNDQKLSDLPVVLVTSLSSREDRERGIDVGADAYIAKSSFDQTNLLEIIQRLV